MNNIELHQQPPEKKNTFIQISLINKSDLDSLKTDKKETYNHVVERLIKFHKDIFLAGEENG